ncbi:GNAT family N-acetyltransferase [Oligoflexus tunisiensis]|uniref:GNAT family N-acetyltransferase n=1 Tax=Oligoflexus tunisiensis TaxID=708132 RepID=UPI00114CEDA7|nr:GNAT family N-acetyltransferase [Oligoflexus tunisiensis]
MYFSIFRDVTAMPRDVDAFLRPDPLINNVPLGLLERMRRGINFKDYCLFVVRDEAHQVVQYAHLLPPNPLCLAAGNGIEALKHGIQTAGISYPRVQGRKELVEAFLDSGMKDHRVHVERQGLYKLTRLLPHRPTGASFEHASPADLEMLVDWAIAFRNECNLPGADRTESVVHIKERIDAGDIFVLRYEGAVVSTVSAGRVLPKGRSIGFVYTPHEHRRKGYAEELTARVTAFLLQNGNEYCCLFTQLDNKTSNRIYQNIGYEWVCEFLSVTTAES